MLFFSALLLVTIGLAHSYLGERYILIRLFRRDNIPKVLGSSAFTKSTLRFAWHLTTLCWFGFAGILISLSNAPLDRRAVLNIIAAIFLVHFLMAFAGSKGKHFSWLFFLSISLATFYVANISSMY
ncbi:hypothetical protein SAMN02745866_01022 [Alteromonadaceae bacterium Bs31]|nr:hypothetical protein SAMN02745866_01022 [Alteromonadaceae bacterium Bs31]